MADILRTWLNSEVGLSREIKDFEEDFSSGYLFGELLYKFNQQSDFELFSKKDAISHKLENFAKLEPTLRNLNIKFDSKMVDKIMKNERGVALRLLYQLKMMLEKVYPPTDIAVLAKTGQFGDNQPAQKISQPKETYDKVQHAFFRQRLQVLNKPQKQLNMEQHLQKFDDEHKRQNKKASTLNKKDAENDERRKQEMRRIQIGKLQRNAGFMEEWLQKGVEDWKQNQVLKKEREAAQLEFEYKQAEKYNKLALTKLENADREVNEGISKFEHTLMSQGINPRVTKYQADSAITQSFTKEGQTKAMSVTLQAQGTIMSGLDGSLQTKTGAFTLASTKLKHRTKQAFNEETRKNRDKRRKRLIAHQSEVFDELDRQHRQSLVIELMKHQSNQERELEYEEWRTKQCKNVIIENRKLRENQYEKRRIIDVENAEFKEKQMLETMKEQSQRQVGEMMYRITEMEGYHQTQKRKDHTELCARLVESIFDIADEAYKHQQDKDCTETDPRNWHEWQQLFVEAKVIENTLPRLAQMITEETAGAETADLNLHGASTAKLDELELVDYLQNKGQWPATLVSQSPVTLEQVLNPPAEVQAPVGKGKAAAKGQAAAETVSFEPADLELSSQAENNYLLGDALEQIIKINFEQRAQLKHPQTASWLPLKICLAGYPFAGKKTQAAFIAKKFGLHVFQMDQLVQEAIEFSDQNAFPIPPHPEHEMSHSTVETQISSEDGGWSEDEETTFNLPEEWRLLGKQCKELLMAGQEVTDELLVQLFVTNTRTVFKYKSPKTKRKELKLKARKSIDIESRLIEISARLEVEGLRKKEIKELETERDQLKEAQLQLEDLGTERGWVLVDFPTTYAQAKLLEQAISGYKPDVELELTAREQEINDMLLLVKPHEKEAPPKKLLPSGIDAVIWFDCSTQECLRRADGRRIEANGNARNFHIEDVPPPTSEAPLCERLESLSDDSNSVASLVDRFLSFYQQTNSLKRWLEMFGVEQNNRQLIQTIDANAKQQDVSQTIERILDEIIELKKHNSMVMREVIAFKMRQKFEKLLAEQKAEEERLAREQEEADLLAAQAAEETEVVAAPVETTKKGGKRGAAEKPAEPEPKPKEVKETEKTSSSHAELREVIPIVPPSLPGRDNVDNDFKPVLIDAWRKAYANYVSQMKTVFCNVRMHREQYCVKSAAIQSQFLTFLHRKDRKQECLTDFVKSFNDFSDDFPDLREDDQTKEELHQRTDVLSDELWEIVEERKEQSIEERKKIMESGFVESSQEYLTQCARQLMQSELDKFKVVVQIIHDYYHAIEEKLIPEAPPMTVFELAFEGDEKPNVETLAEGQDASKIESYTYPRLDKYLAMALKQQFVPDVTQIQAAPEVKKGGKPAPAKKGAKDAVEEEKTVEETIYVKEMKQALKVEKGILRFRLMQIRNWAFKQLRQKRESALELYKKLEDWIYVSQKAEMDAIEEMCVVIKDAIEEESKIQSELRIDFMDFTVDQLTLNYITPPPPLLKALEQSVPERFQIPNLENMLREFETITRLSGKQLMHSEAVADFLNRKVTNSNNYSGFDTALCKSWDKLNHPLIQGMLRNLDPNNTGLVNWRQLFTYTILLTSRVPTQAQIKQMVESLGGMNAQVTLENFISKPFWFDETEKSIDRPYSVPFPRLQNIKVLLFRTNADASQTYLNVEQFVRFLQIASAQKNATDFNGFLFAPVKTLQQ